MLYFSLGTNLIPYGELICKIIMSTLKNISFEEAFSVASIW